MQRESQELAQQVKEATEFHDKKAAEMGMTNAATFVGTFAAGFINPAFAVAGAAMYFKQLFDDVPGYKEKMEKIALQESKQALLKAEQAVKETLNQPLSTLKSYISNIHPTPFDYETELPHREALRARGISFEPYQA